MITPLGSETVVIASRRDTVSSVLPLTPASVAEMLVLPRETAVASPLALMVATAVLDEDHVTWLVMFWVLLSE